MQKIAALLKQHEWTQADRRETRQSNKTHVQPPMHDHYFAAKAVCQALG
jgi:hypothetical protein